MRHRVGLGLAAAGLVSLAGEAHASIEFTDRASEVGIDYVHAPSARRAIMDQFYAESLMTPKTFEDLIAQSAGHDAGQPGVALFDFDGDGDLDIYVTNGIGAPNALYANLLVESGSLGFIDVAAAAGVEATEQDSSGVCFGDTDNDGDPDLFVVGDDAPHRFFENQGDGTFSDATPLSDGAFPVYPGGTSCVFGDVDQDGLLDLHITHAYDYERQEICLTTPFAFEPPNELFLNAGGGVWTPVSDSSGIRQLGGLPPGVQGITWAAAMVDYDGDGDVDLLNADDQCGLPPAAVGGLDRGFIQVWANDGTGFFVNRTVEAGTRIAGQWMGLAIADFDGNGYLDLFGTNMGDYAFLPVGVPYQLGLSTSRWLLGGPGGTFSDPGVGPELVASPFGWGASAEDFDNDGDTDIAFMGGISLQMLASNDNPNTLLVNEGSGTFSYDPGAFDYGGLSRNPVGMAAGDLDQDGFVDVVSVSSFDIPNDAPLVPVGVAYGSPFDETAFFVPIMTPDGAGFVWTGLEFPGGSVAVDINGGESGHGSVSVRTLGTVGLTSQGRVNRDGIGAVVRFTPKGGETAMRPVQGGSSHVSADALERVFGLEDAPWGTLDVAWPGGVRNRLHHVRRGSRVTLPEIPCSYDDTSLSESEYRACVRTSLRELLACGSISPAERGKLFASAIMARRDWRRATSSG